MNYSIQWLREKCNEGESFKYDFFWGHTQEQEGIIDKACLSQWFIAPFTVEGIKYPSTEHWMMAGKAKLFADAEALTGIIATPKPAIAKNIGRQVRGFCDDVWKANAYNIVVEGNFHKFSQHEALKQFLLQTGNKIIVEASPFDQIWGIGMAQSSPGVSDPNLWKGTNLPGFALMEVRDMLQSKTT
ncbi:MAG: NADAR family protein [Chitinophagaceae bacterium]